KLKRRAAAESSVVASTAWLAWSTIPNSVPSAAKARQSSVSSTRQKAGDKIRSAPPMSLTPGTRLGSYEVVAAIGEGGMGEVYRAHDPRLGRDVALKVLPADVAHDPARLERFRREARAVAALNHPHIVTIYSTEEADGIPFLTMELVEGQSLK